MVDCKRFNVGSRVYGVECRGRVYGRVWEVECWGNSVAGRV